MAIVTSLTVFMAASTVYRHQRMSAIEHEIAQSTPLNPYVICLDNNKEPISQPFTQEQVCVTPNCVKTGGVPLYFL